MSRILVVEDEPSVAGIVSRALAGEHFQVKVANTFADAVDSAESFSPDLVILDLMLPDGDGLDLLARSKAIKAAQILVLTAKGGWEDKVKGLDRGADDYLTKPFRLEELVARVRALLRRKGASLLVEAGDLRIDLLHRTVSLGGRKIFLSSTEFALLELLASSPGLPVSRSEILTQLWDDAARDTNVVEVYINYLRKKLDRTGFPNLISTVRGKGYMLAQIEPR